MTNFIELVDELRLESKNMHYEKADGALFAKAADAIKMLITEIEKYRHAAFIIGETCVEESKKHISEREAIQKVRKNIYYSRPFNFIEETK